MNDINKMIDDEFDLQEDCLENEDVFLNVEEEGEDYHDVRSICRLQILCS
jgi:hypothetical protein